MSNISRLCVITQQQSFLLMTQEHKSLKVKIHWQRKYENGVQKPIYGSQLFTHHVVKMCKQANSQGNQRMLQNANSIQLSLKISQRYLSPNTQTYLPVQLRISYQKLFHCIQNQRRWPQMLFFMYVCMFVCMYVCMYVCVYIFV